jgi:hypothetical protein
VANIVAVVLAVIFLIGAVIGAIMLVSLAIHREDRRVRLRRQAGGVRGAPLAARMLVTFGPQARPGGDAVALRAMR